VGTARERGEHRRWGLRRSYRRVVESARGRQMSMVTFKELTELPDEKIIEKFDEVASWSTTVSGGTRELQAMVYLSELARRGQQRQTSTIVRMTVAMAAMTLAILVFTAILALKH